MDRVGVLAMAIVITTSGVYDSYGDKDAFWFHAFNQTTSGTPGVPSTDGSNAADATHSDTSQPAEPVCPPTLFTHGTQRDIFTDCNAAGGTEMTPWIERPEEEGVPAEDVTFEQIVVSREDVQSLLVNSGSLEIQPDQPWVLVNIDTIAMTDADEHMLSTQVLGLDVDVRVTPALFTWDFGDGSEPISGTDPGAPWPNHTVSHVYREAGTVTIALRTEWDAAFQVVGTTGWVPVTGRAVTVESSDPIEVVTATPRLTVG